MKFSIVIATCNRKKQVLRLVFSLKSLDQSIFDIIVVDSSDEINDELNSILKYNYIKTSIKNQPYQRYLGYLVSKSELLIFFDDDIEIVSKDIFEVILTTFQENSIAGLGLKFTDKFSTGGLSQVPRSVTSKLNSRKDIIKLARCFTGNIELKNGEFSWNGLRGNQPLSLGVTQWFSGGAFVARRDSLFHNFNFNLFDIFNNNLGMGEDLIISYTLSKQGLLYFLPTNLLLHDNSIESSYTYNYYAYSKRVIYSRLYLSIEYARLNNENKLKAFLIYHWYVSWRILGLFINFIIQIKSERFYLFSGAISGWFKSFELIKRNVNENKGKWILQAQNDIINLNETKIQ